MIKRLAIILLLCLACALPAQAWQIQTSGPLRDRCYSVANIPGLGFLAGSYKGDGRIYIMDPATLAWSVWRILPVSLGHESISYIWPIDGRAGVNVSTEDSNGPQFWTAWQDQDWQFTRTPAEYPTGMEYALGSPEAAALGITAISAGHGRDLGAVLASWDINAWRPFTTGLRYNGRPCLIWTAAVHNGRLLAGASASTSEYLAPGAGLLAEWITWSWDVIPTPDMAGIVRITKLDNEPGAIYLSTARNQIWRTTDLRSFTLFHAGDDCHADAWIFEINQRRIVANARGQIWDEGQLVMDRQQTAWMSPIKITLPNGRQVLAGTITDEGDGFSRFMRIEPPEYLAAKGGGS